MQRDSPMFINGASGPEIGLPSRISGSAHFVCFVVPGHVPVPTTRCTVPIARSDNFLCNCNGFRTRKQRFLSKAVVAGGRGHRRLCTATLSPRLCSLAATQVVQVLAETDILFPLHVHWLCNSFFVMHVVRSASGREPTNAYRPSLWCRTPMGDETYSFPCGHVHWLCNSFFVMHVTRSLAILLRGAGRRFAWRSCECWRPLRILGSQRSLEAKHPRAPREALLLQGALCLWLRRGVLRRPERAAQAHTHSG